MEKMIDSTIELGRLEVAMRMEWVELAFNETNDTDTAFLELFKLQKGGN